MRRLVKSISSKKGFTLLEVILSIAIMLILTTMMMNGFAATMSYSYHTSIYSQTAAANYKTAISSVADKVGNADIYKTIDKAGAAGQNITLTLQVTGGANRSMHARRYMYLNGTESIDDKGFRAERENHTGFPAGEDGTYSNNRISFYYVPYVNINGNVEATRGCIKVKRFKSGSDWVYYWYDTVNGTRLSQVI